MGRKAREGPRRIERTFPGYLYCFRRGIPAGRWGDGSDEIKIKLSGGISSDIRIWGGDPCD